MDSVNKSAFTYVFSRNIFARLNAVYSTKSENSNPSLFEAYLQQELSQTSRYILLKDKYEMPYLQPAIEISIKLENKSTTINAGIWNPKDKFVQNDGYQMKKVKRFFRVGIGKSY